MKMKKIIALVLCAILLVAGSVLGTIAYLSDTDAQVNTFSSGMVGIELDEAIVTPDENDDLVVETGRTSETQNYELHPGQTVTKDPTITVDSTSLDAYVAAKVVITCEGLDSLIGVEGYDNLDITKLASGGLMDAESTQVNDWNGLPMVYETDECVIYQEVTTPGSVWTLYIFMTEPQAANAEIVLFDTLTIPADYNNAEMAILNNMQMDISAYATQTAGFDSCFEAITTAFEDYM